MKKSPARNTFQKNNYLKRKAEEGRTPDNDETVKAMVSYYESWSKTDAENEQDLEWRENNLEYDLRSTDWICAKAKDSEAYAQNLYAAMCNNDFQKNEMMPILKGQTWGCSWRHAGGIIADMREEGDYIDWYCSGIKGDGGSDKEPSDFVGEGHVTDEVRADLKKLGWVVVDTPDDDIF
jgi:hypothetical protein